MCRNRTGLSQRFSELAKRPSECHETPTRGVEMAWQFYLFSEAQQFKVLYMVRRGKKQQTSKKYDISFTKLGKRKIIFWNKITFVKDHLFYFHNSLKTVQGWKHAWIVTIVAYPPIMLFLLIGLWADIYSIL